MAEWVAHYETARASARCADVPPAPPSSASEAGSRSTELPSEVLVDRSSLGGRGRRNAHIGASQPHETIASAGPGHGDGGCADRAVAPFRTFLSLRLEKPHLAVSGAGPRDVRLAR